MATHKQQQQQQQQQQLIAELVKAVKENSDSTNFDEAARYATLKLQLTLSQQRIQRPRVESFGWKQLVGLNAVDWWTLVGVLTLGVIVYGRYSGHYDVIETVYTDVNRRCIVKGQLLAMELARPPVDCSVCRDLRQMPIEYNMTKELFLERYAYTKRPVLIKNAVSNWTALKTFSLKFFRDLYDASPDNYRKQDKTGDFNEYFTGFKTLKEALHMSEERQKEPWYFGWGNTDDYVRQELRKHYQRPDFLPDDAETSRVDWIFMGTNKIGAPMHLDYFIRRPSWQAQIVGKKTWQLVPSPECFSVCNSFNVTVHPGDIINFDTTRWYHSTNIHPGDLSLVIGSEYD